MHSVVHLKAQLCEEENLAPISSFSQINALLHFFLNQYQAGVFTMQNRNLTLATLHDYLVFRIYSNHLKVTS